MSGVASKILNGRSFNSSPGMAGRVSFFCLHWPGWTSLHGVGADRADFLGGDAQLSSDRPHGGIIEKWSIFEIGSRCGRDL